MREIADSRGIVLIYDEVITGFRLGFGGAQGIYGIKPDISVFAKGLGGGFPVAALGGRRDIMRLVADGTVSMAGTYSANGIAVAAANAALDELGDTRQVRGAVRTLRALLSGPAQAFRAAWAAGLRGGLGARFCRCGSQKQPIRNYRDAARYADHDIFRRWWEGMLERDVLFHPGAFENLFVSFAHSDADIDRTLAAADEVAGTTAGPCLTHAARRAQMAPVLGIDLGTSAVKVVAVGLDDAVLG